MDAARTIWRRLSVTETRRSCLLVLSSQCPRFSITASPKRGDVNAAGAGLAASLCRGVRREAPLFGREKLGCGSRHDSSLLGWGCPGHGVPGRAEGACGDLGEGGAAHRAPGAAEALTFQRKPAARVVLPWAGPHHPGHRSGQCGHPGGSFSWKLYPGEGELERRAWRW